MRVWVQDGVNGKFYYSWRWGWTCCCQTVIISKYLDAQNSSASSMRLSSISFIRSRKGVRPFLR